MPLIAIDDNESIDVGRNDQFERRKLKHAIEGNDGRAVVPPRLLWQRRDEGHHYDDPIESEPG